MLGMVIAYDAAGEVVGTLDFLVSFDENGNPQGLVDFDAHEQAGGEVTDYWTQQGAVGAKAWPEWLGSQVYDFRVERVGPPGRKHASALVHKESGHRRERAACEAAIEATPIVDGARDIRAIVGGPDRPLTLDATGRTKEKEKIVRPNLPIVPYTG